MKTEVIGILAAAIVILSVIGMMTSCEKHSHDAKVQIATRTTNEVYIATFAP